MYYIIIVIVLIVILLVAIYYEYHSKKDVTVSQFDYLENLINKCIHYINRIKDVEEGDFDTLLDIHKSAWISNVCPRSLKCSESGKFRVNDILFLELSNIYLTLTDSSVNKSILEWCKDPDTKMDAWYKYKNILIGSIGSYKQELIIEQKRLVL